MAPPLCPIRELKACSPTQLSSNGTWFAYFVARENADQERRRPPNFWRPKFSFGDTDGSRRRPLCAKSGHWSPHSIISSARPEPHVTLVERRRGCTAE